MTTGAEERGVELVEGIEAELRTLAAAREWDFDTVYLGGGTPSALPVELLERLLESLREALDLAPEARISLEANPEDVSERSSRAWRRLGVHTLSVGVQSFHEESLRFLGRRHDAAAGRRAVACALESGFDCVSVDLIFGLPESVPAASEGLETSLGQVEKLRPHHVSCYQLTFHDSTPFGRALGSGRLEELGEAGQVDLFSRLHERLAKAGWAAYEVSNFAMSPRYQSRHNRKYWSHVPYLGLGPSAHSFDGSRRWWNERGLDDYLRLVASGRDPVAGSETLISRDLALEHLMLRLRTTDGLVLSEFVERFDTDLLAVNRARIQLLVDEGRLVLEGDRLRPTRRGLAVADGMAASLALS